MPITSLLPQKRLCPSVVLLALITCLLLACGGEHRMQTPATKTSQPAPETEEISATRMRELVQELSSEKYAGRLPGSRGDKLTQAYLIAEFEQIGLVPAYPNSYLQSFPSTIVEPDGTSHANPANPLLGKQVSSNNILGLIPGHDAKLKQEVIIISAHHDHLGWTADGRYYPGANDDLSGVAALVELARAFKARQQRGIVNRRSLLFVAYGAEEQREMGSIYHANHPLPDFPNEKITLMISIDMIGRGYRAWRELSSQQTDTYIRSWLAQMHNEARDDSDDFSHEYPPQTSRYFSYDAGPFAQLGVTNRVFGRAQGIPHYHQTSDTWDTLDYPSAARFTQSIFDFLLRVDEAD